MNIILLIIEFVLILLLASFLVSKYLDIVDKRKKKIINIVFITITIIAIILVIIFFFYFLNVISKLGPTI